MVAASAAGASAGITLASLNKALKAGGYKVDKNRGTINTVLKQLLTQRYLVRVKGTGASTSFKVNKDLPEAGRKEVAQKKKIEVKRVRWTKMRKAAVTGSAADKKKRKQRAKRQKTAGKATLGRPVTRSQSATNNGSKLFSGVL